MRPRFRHFYLLLTLVTAILGLNAHASSTLVGTVVLATGDSWRLKTDGREPLTRQDKVFVGDHLVTVNGSMTLRMQDNAIVNLQPHSEMIIHAYRAAEAGREAAIRFELKQGKLRTRTGAIGEGAHHRYRLDTPFAALGIRGTDYTASLQNNELGVFVHSGAIRLSPFSQALGCIPGSLGACNTPESADLSEHDSAWLRLRPGDGIERISGIPDFVSTKANSPFFSGGMYDANGKLLTPTMTHEQVIEFVEQDNNLPEKSPQPDDPSEPPLADLEGLRDALLLDADGDTDNDGVSDQEELANNLNPWLADTDGDGLNDAEDPDPRKGGSHLFSVDNRSGTYSAEQMREYLRYTSMRVDAYDPVASHAIYNVQLTLRDSLKLNGWLDLQQKRLWGKTGSIETLLAARYWPEGLLWEALPDSLTALGAEEYDWLLALRQDNIDLWQLPLDRHSIWFTPGETLDFAGTQTFDTSWVQPLGNPAGHGKQASISGFKADANGRFQMLINTGGSNYTLRGAVGESGVLFAENDYLSLKGHWQGNTLIILISENKSSQQWMFGLQHSGVDDRPLLAQWQSRETSEGVSWGHWADFAELDSDKISFLSSDNPNIAFNRHYALETPGAQDLPTSGRVQFNLNDSSAVYSSKDGLRPAEVINPMLLVDFDQKKFVSKFDVSAPGLDDAVSIQGAGQFDENGLMQSDDALSNAQLEGGFGPNGDSASLLFERELGDDSHVSGITHWN
ncbi:FecR family protein [Marinobacterium stanieri]|uniref:FecR family protein n=1 Tax=Marinobacterium stanieri TaxID=49186 RepID=A0A1N6WC05_9GAMM|nr:FecR domain-containing protein [Marinobacterium stanieri]SIQ87657.1 FecR family protein [Marinobacterium stanieri]